MFELAVLMVGFGGMVFFILGGFAAILWGYSEIIAARNMREDGGIE